MLICFNGPKNPTSSVAALSAMVVEPVAAGIITALNGLLWWMTSEHFKYGAKKAISEAVITSAVGGAVLSAASIGIFLACGGCGALVEKMCCKKNLEASPLLPAANSSDKPKGLDDSDYLSDLYCGANFTALASLLFSGILGSQIWHPEHSAFSAEQYIAMQVGGALGTGVIGGMIYCVACLIYVGISPGPHRAPQNGRT